METESPQMSTARDGHVGGPVNGAALAAVLAAGVGGFAVGLFVILNETGIYAAPSLYGPAGGVSGRTTFAVGVWLLAWVLLHRAWKERQMEARGVYLATTALTVVGLLLTFPPFWGIF